MAQIKNNKPAGLTIDYFDGKGISRLELLPGVNISIPDSTIESLKNHPVFNSYIEDGVLVFLSKAPSPKGELGGFEVTENKATDEPIPIIPAKISKAA